MQQSAVSWGLRGKGRGQEQRDEAYFDLSFHTPSQSSPGGSDWSSLQRSK
jgi:hypothetical protein